MTHEKRAEKFIQKLFLKAYGRLGEEELKEIKSFMHNLKEMMKKEIMNET